MKRGGFDQLCAVSAALEVVGDRWALLVVRELLFSPKRFSELHHGLPGIGTNTLAARLVELEEGGILRKRTTPPPLSVAAYELTERGRQLEPVLVALARWGSHELAGAHPKHRLQPTWLALAMLAYHDAAARPRTPLKVALVFPDGALTVDLARDGLHIAEGEPADAALTLRAARSETLLAILRGAVTVAQAKKRGDLRVEGEPALVKTFLACFPLGPPR